MSATMMSVRIQLTNVWKKNLRGGWKEAGREKCQVAGRVISIFFWRHQASSPERWSWLAAGW